MSVTFWILPHEVLICITEYIVPVPYCVWLPANPILSSYYMEEEKSNCRAAILRHIDEILLMRYLYPTEWKRLVQPHTDLWLTLVEIKHTLSNIDNPVLLNALLKHSSIVANAVSSLTTRYCTEHMELRQHLSRDLPKGPEGASDHMDVQSSNG